MMKIVKSISEFNDYEHLNCKLCRKLKIPYLYAERESVYGPGKGRVIGWRYYGPDFSRNLGVIQCLLINLNQDNSEDGENFKALFSLSLSNEAKDICIESGLHYNIALAMMSPIHKVIALFKTFKLYKTKYNKEYKLNY